MNPMRIGSLRGTGAAINVECGWIPDLVEIFNATDGTIITFGWTGFLTIAFSSGGVNILKRGYTIKGATSGAIGVIDDVIVDTGTFGAGNATGWFIIDPASVKGTFAGENVYVIGNGAAAAGGIDDATIVAAIYPNESVVLATAPATGNAAISAYLGDVALGKSRGFTVGSTVSVANKLMFYRASRNQDGGQMRCANSLPLV